MICTLLQGFTLTRKGRYTRIKGPDSQQNAAQSSHWGQRRPKRLHIEQSRLLSRFADECCLRLSGTHIHTA